jgi:hypothetical protein
VTDIDDVNYPPSPSVDVARAPAGVHLVADLQNLQISLVRPVDVVLQGHANPTVFDVLPDRGPKAMPASGIAFTLGGAHFDAIAGPVNVTFGGAVATGVSVAGPNWITGMLPSNPAGGCPIDVRVTAGGVALTLPRVFCYLPDKGAPWPAAAAEAAAATPAA